MVEIEKMGTPAVPIVSGRFQNDAIASARAFGLPDLQFVVVPRIYRNLDLEECVSQTEGVIDDLIRVMTSNTEEKRRLRVREGPGVEVFEGEDRFNAVQRMNDTFMERDWGDGYPLLPATEEAVEELLKGTNLPPDYVVGDMPPGYGLATVEKIAINAAMAGAKPEHMPVIIGAVKAIGESGT